MQAIRTWWTDRRAGRQAAKLEKEQEERQEEIQAEPVLIDRILLFSVLALMAFGLVMVSSASLPEAERLTGNPWHFAVRHSVYLGGACVLIYFVLRIPVQWWQDHSHLLLFASIVMMLLVLVPGLGHTVKGATRWLNLVVIKLQVAEVAKLTFFVYLAGYLVRRLKDLHHHTFKQAFLGVVRPCLVVGGLAFLLLQQPDLGSLAVIAATMFGMLWLAGASLPLFMILMASGLIGTVLLIVFEPYRWARVTAFLDPWEDPFGSGYQLTQSLMAFGRGGLTGEGLGSSIQKLHYLPEAHNDFLVAIVAEEIGFIGVATLILLLSTLIWRGFCIGRRGLSQNRLFAGLLAYGISIWFAFQSLVNVASAAGAMPPKGLTLPLVSYGGSSLLIMSVAVALLMRIDFEGRWHDYKQS